MTEAIGDLGIRSASYSNIRSDVSWTASRCNRLLRPLISKINAIRKTAQHEALRHDHPTKHAKPRNHPKKDPSALWEPSEKESEDDNDQDWGALKLRMKVKRRYTSKPNHKSSEEQVRCMKAHTKKHISIAPGQIVVSTPLLVRTLPQPIPDLSHHNLQRQTRDILDRSGEGFSKSSKRDNSHNNSLTEGLCVAVDVLLRNTCDEKRGITEEPASPRTGPRSLFSTCLRAVPTYIASEDRSGESDSNRDEEDATAETYTWLEENECMPGRGWPHMRQVVRSHAMHLLKEAIQDGTLSAGATNTVLRQVFLSGSLEQVWMLREALLDNQAVNDTKSSSAGSHLLDTHDDGMRTFVSTISTVFNSFHLRCVSKLLNSGKIDILRLANRDFEEFWVRIINSLSQRDCESHAALQIVDVFLRIACEPQSSCENDRAIHVSGRSRSRHSHETVLQSRVTSLCIILVTIGLTDKVNSICTDEAPLPDIIRPIRSAVVASSQKNQPPRRPILACIVATADLMFELSTLPDDAGPAHTRRARQTIRHINRVRMYNSKLDPRDLSTEEPLSRFVSALALCYDRTGRCGAGFAMLKHIARRLMDPRLESVAQEYPFAWTLALRSAAAFAQQSNKAQHVLFAQQLERVASDPRGGHTARNCNALGRRTQSTRFRWEEGICEWVVATPARVDVCKVEGTAKSLEAAGNEWATRTRKRKTGNIFAGMEVLEDEEDLSSVAERWTLSACVVPGEDFMITPVSTAKTTVTEHKWHKSGPLVPRSGNDACPRRRPGAGTCSVASENNDDNNEENDDDVDELSACLDTVSTTQVMHKRRRTIRRANQPFMI